MPRSEDPVCPACGEGVGSTSTYCMHCDAEFDAPATRVAGTGGRGDGESGSGNDDLETGTATPDSVEDYGTATPDSVEDYGTTGDGYDGDHPLDGAARVVALALAVLLGLAATVTVALAFAQQPTVWLPLAGIALAGTGLLGAHVWRFETGRGALTRSLYVTAGGLVVVPIAFFLLVGDGSFGSRAILTAAFGAIGVVFAIPTALVGYWLSPDRV